MSRSIVQIIALLVLGYIAFIAVNEAWFFWGGRWWLTLFPPQRAMNPSEVMQAHVAPWWLAGSIALGVVIIAAAVVFHPVRQFRLKRGLCPTCAYPVGTNPHCTECGKPVNNQSCGQSA